MLETVTVTMNRVRSIIINNTDTDRFPIESPLIRSAMASTIVQSACEDPESLFKFLMGTLVAIGITAKVWPHLQSSNWIGSKNKDKCCAIVVDKISPEVASLQKRYLPVFYLFRMSFWMSGPYFYQVYSSKTLRHLDGTTSPATSEFVAQVSLVGYLAIVLLGPMVGRKVDQYGRKTATICTGAMYALGSLSVFSDITVVLYLGRAMASIASSRLTSSPEAWLIQEYLQIQKKQRDEEKEPDQGGLSETFGLAYGGDAIVAILAGQTASIAASRVGHPTGPFLVSPLFVAAALLVTVFVWVENIGCDQKVNGNKKEAPSEECSIRAGAKALFSDPKIFLIGLVQSLFEGSMYIFVLVWPPVLSNIIRSYFGTTAVTPFGTIFSCFMACCLLGSVLFGQLRKKSVNVKYVMTGILLVSTMSFFGSIRAVQADNLFGVLSTFFAFEACVGMYFPSIGIIRAALLPESHRLAITTLFAVPLNVLVVGVISFQPTLGNVGSLTVAGIAMSAAAMCMVLLERRMHKEKMDKLDSDVAAAVRVFTAARKWKASTCSASSVPSLKRVSLNSDDGEDPDF